MARSGEEGEAGPHRFLWRNICHCVARAARLHRQYAKVSQCLTTPLASCVPDRYCGRCWRGWREGKLAFARLLPISRHKRLTSHLWLTWVVSTSSCFNLVSARRGQSACPFHHSTTCTKSPTELGCILTRNLLLLLFDDRVFRLTRQ